MEIFIFKSIGLKKDFDKLRQNYHAQNNFAFVWMDLAIDHTSTKCNSITCTKLTQLLMGEHTL